METKLQKRTGERTNLILEVITKAGNVFQASIFYFDGRFQVYFFRENDNGSLIFRTFLDFFPSIKEAVKRASYELNYCSEYL